MNPVKEFYEEVGKVLKPHADDLQGMAGKINVSKVTMWRWLNGINSKYPDKDRLLRFLSHISGMNSAKGIADYFGGEISKFILQGANRLDISNKYLMFKDSPADVIEDFNAYVIFNICGTARGATENELVNVIGNLAIKKSGIPKSDITQELINAYGHIAKNKIKELVQKEVILRDASGRFERTNKNITFPARYSVEYLPQVLAQMIKPEEVGLGYNSLFSYTESIPDSVAHDLAIKTKDFFKECMELMDANVDKNGTHYTIINFAERFWFDSIKLAEA